MKKQFSSLDIGFLSSAEMRKLNARYRQKDYATDVLSFPPPPAASLAICLQVTKRQAKEHGVTYKEELQRMTIHGVLHLLGYDHEKSSRAERTMTALQESILESLQ